MKRKSHTSAQASAARLPSKVTDEYWLHAKPATGRGPLPTERSGKWLLFVPLLNIDAMWSRIKCATEQGTLGFASKVATAKPNPNATNSWVRLICVYTYDWTDKADVMRVRDELRTLGVTSRIRYKADQDTREGKYASQGQTQISKYYE
jgi:hypothetical protein